MEAVMSEEHETVASNETKGIGNGFRRAFWWVIRLLVVIIFGIGVGAGVYYGIPALYRGIIEPTRRNTQHIADLEEAIAQMQDASRKQLEGSDDRLADVEGKLAQQAEEMATLQAEMATLEEEQSDLATEINVLGRLADQVESLAIEFEETVARVDGVEMILETSGVPAQQLEYRLQLIRSMTILTRARLWLVQDNLGTAAEDIEDARAVLLDALRDAMVEDVETLEPIVRRLDLALDDIRVSPSVAADELEIAWKLLSEAAAPPATEAEDVLEDTLEENAHDSR
jgi:chromosome segregation ATPase